MFWKVYIIYIMRQKIKLKTEHIETEFIWAFAAVFFWSYQHDIGSTRSLYTPAKTHRSTHDQIVQDFIPKRIPVRQLT